MWQRLAVSTGSEETTEGMRRTSIQEYSTLGWRTAEREMATKNLAKSETEDGTWEKLTTTTAAHKIEGKLQEHYKKLLDFWNLVDTYNADVVIGTESWLRGEICKA